jgi:hypothetical protein
MDESTQQTKTALIRPIRQFPQQQEEKKERIKLWMGAALVITAGGIDLIQGLLNLVVVGNLFIGSIISVCADFIFLIWLWMLGVGFVKNPKIFATTTIQALVGLVPVLDTLPELTLGILIIVLLVKAEDKGGLLGKAAGMAQMKIKA